MMSADDSAETPFVLIDPATEQSILMPPTGWAVSTHQVNNFSVVVHQRPRSNTSAIPPILTLSDVGNNSDSLAPFFSTCRAGTCPEIDAASAHIHLTLPGHQPAAPLLPASESIDIDRLVNTIAQVMDRFELTKIIALGVGLGAAVLLRAAIKDPTKFAGLVLISPLIYASSTFERLGVATDAMFTRQLGLGLRRSTKDRFLTRWLSDDSRAENFALVQSVEEGLDRLNPGNVSKMVSVDVWRDDVSQMVGKIGRCLLVTGKESSLRWHVNDCFGNFNGEYTSWLDIQGSGSLVHEEHAEQVAESLALFLQCISPMD